MRIKEVIKSWKIYIGSMKMEKPEKEGKLKEILMPDPFDTFIMQE